MTLWLTRPQPGNATLAAALAVRDIASLAAPVHYIRILPTAITDSGFNAVITTSQHALAGLSTPDALTHLPLYTVGAASLAAAQEKRFTRAEILAQDAAHLAQAIMVRHPEPVHFFYPRAREIRLDLAAELGAAGHRVTESITYAAEYVPELPPEFLQRWPEISGVVLYSARACAAVETLMRRYGLTPAQPIDAFCLSPAIASALTRNQWGKVFTSPRPDEESLLETILFAKSKA
jgi:uroporphyrinogen-III synthase